MSEPELAGRRVAVAGLARSGVAASDALVTRGALVTALDSATDGPVVQRAEQAERLGVRVVLGPDAQALPGDVDLVVASPGWPPHAPLLVQAARREV